MTGWIGRHLQRFVDRRIAQDSLICKGVGGAVIERVTIVAPRTAWLAGYSGYSAIILVHICRAARVAFDIAPANHHIRTYLARLRLVSRNLGGRTQDPRLLRAEERIAAVHQIVAVGWEGIKRY